MRSNTSGYSLVEVIIAASILSIVAAGVSSVTMLTSRIAYSNIYEYTAHTVAHAYAEQIKSIHFRSIKNALEDPVKYSIPTESLALGTGNPASDLKIDDPLIFGVPVTKDIIVDIEEDENGEFSERKMSMTVLATGNDLNDTTNCWDAIEVTLDFTWDVVDSTGTTSHSSQIKIVKTNVTEY